MVYIVYVTTDRFIFKNCISFCRLVMPYVIGFVLLRNLIGSSLLLLYSKMKIFCSRKGGIVTIRKFWEFCGHLLARFATVVCVPRRVDRACYKQATAYFRAFLGSWSSLCLVSM